MKIIDPVGIPFEELFCMGMAELQISHPYFLLAVQNKPPLFTSNDSAGCATKIGSFPPALPRRSNAPTCGILTHREGRTASNIEHRTSKMSLNSERCAFIFHVMKLERFGLIAEVSAALERGRAVGLVGPRQCGKSTLARQIGGRRPDVEYFDLEDPGSEARLRDAKLTLDRLRGLVIIDEVQRRPDLMPLLRVLLDRDPLPARYLLLGSASPELLCGASESLAGRIEFIEMEGFSLEETGSEFAGKLWLRGGFPLSYLATNNGDSFPSLSLG